jgi:hypothetical protein
MAMGSFLSPVISKELSKKLALDTAESKLA